MVDTIIKVVLAAVVVLELLYFINTKEKYKLLLKDGFWIIFVWTICLFLYYFSGINYAIKMSNMVFLYIILFWVLYFIGKGVTKVILEKSTVASKVLVEDTEAKKEKKHDFSLLFIVSLISLGVYTVLMFMNNDIVFGETRSFNTSSLNTLFLIISSSSLIIWLYELAYALSHDKKLPIYAWLSAIVFNAPGLLISGRDALMIFLLSSFITAIYFGNYGIKELNCKGKMYSKLKKGSLIFVAIIFVYLVFLVSNRYGSSAIAQFEWAAGCEFPEYLKFIYNHLGGVGKVIVNVVFYYSSQFSKFSLDFNNYNGPYLKGLYQLHYVSRLLPSSWGLNYSLVSNSVTLMSASAGVAGLKTIWDTMIGYFIFDFGKVITLIMAFVSGVFVEVINKLSYKKQDILHILVRVMLCVGCFITVQFSPLFDYYFIFPSFWLFVMLKMFKKRRRG